MSILSLIFLLAQPLPKVSDPGVVTTRQQITPAGAQAVFQGRVYGVAFGAAVNEVWVLNAGQAFRFDWKSNRVLDRIALEGSPGLQGIRYDAAGGRALASVTRRNVVRLVSLKDGQAEVIADDLGRYIAGAVALAAKPVAVVPLTHRNAVAVVDTERRQLLGHVPTGVAPFGAAVNAAGTVAWVSNWGGRFPEPGDMTGATGLGTAADRVVVDQRGIAASGTVARVDLARLEVTHTLAVGLHPTAILWDEPRKKLYVANGNSDSISVIDTAENRAVQTINLQGLAAPGVAPTALALSPGGAQLFAACGGLNAVAVINARDGKVLGLIPTAWYPNGLAVSDDGEYLAVSTLLGVGSGWRDNPKRRFVHANRGSIAVVKLPGKTELANYTAAVHVNNRLPARVSKPESSPWPIEHVVYIVKENRTYDQVLGDLKKGNGDPSLTMFPREVTPNQHRLAEDFVVLDNFYASGGNSADGHQWVTQANEVDYALWPGYAGRSYPFDGSDPIAYSRGGFIWDSARRAGKTVRIFGEYAGRMSGVPAGQRSVLLDRWKNDEDFTAEWQVKAPIEPLNEILAHNYPTYSTSIPDVVRAQIFLAELRQWQSQGAMPNLVIVQLPSNHTLGGSPGLSSAKAMVADNDLALGRIVEALSRSPFWKKMAIFVVEDDAQNGVDHVDGHRTVALVASPYARRGAVDSTFYSHQSILKTIELIFGLPPLSLFDLIAHDMRASFQDEPDFTAYQALTPEQSLFELNPPLAALRGEARRAALDSMKMRWDVPDAAPTERLNRILWHQVRGWKTPYPPPRRAVFAPLAIDVDDDERN